jgi:Virulence protein RhuM family
MAELFQRDKSVISRHIKNVFDEGELDHTAVVAGSATTAFDGKTYQVEYFHLDVIISVGYRVKSHRGTQFRIWATQRPREYIIKGFTLDDERLKCAGGGLPRIRRVAGDEQEADIHGRLDREARRLPQAQRPRDPAPCGSRLARRRGGEGGAGVRSVRWARAALPAPVEKHFEEAVRDVKQLEKARRASKPEKAPAKVRKKP